MKRFVSIIAVLCLILSCGALFSSCKKDEKDKNGSQVEKITSTSANANATANVNEVETEFEDGKVTQTAYLDVTDKEGNSQTSKVEYSVMGGSDPYVEDIF